MMAEESVYLSFKPVFYVSMFFGTVPLKLIKLPSYHFVQTMSCTVFSSIYFLLCFVHGVTIPFFVNGESKTSSTIVKVDYPGGNVSDYVSFIRNQTSVQMVAMRMMAPVISSFMSLGAQIVSIFFVRNYLPHFFNKLSQVDVSLSTVIPKKDRLDFKITLIVVLYYFILSLPVSLFYLFYSLFYIQGWDFIWTFILTLDNFISFSSEIQFIDLALYLQSRFRTINNYLCEHVELHISTNYFSIYKNLLPFKSQLTLQKIEVLHYSNKKLCELMKDLNGIYQLQLLCGAAGCFIKVLFNLYFAMFGQWVSTLKNRLQITEIILWTIYYLTRFLVTTITASLTSKEAKRTKNLVTSINSRHLSKEIQEELSLFLNHISSIEMNFTACGLLTVDTRLITAALATGTTYLVVLVQFRPQI